MTTPISDPVAPTPALPVARDIRAALPTLAPLLAVMAGLGFFSAMDAAMKGASIALGVYTALLLRNALGTLLAFPIWALGRPSRPTLRRLRLHAFRAAVSTFMAGLFFYGLVRVPMAEAIAISFISPILAQFLAALLLGEVIRPQALLASLLAVVGVVVIAGGSLGDFGGLGTSPETLKGFAAVLGSAMFYAFNLVLQRKQATQAGPGEITLFQNLFCTLFVALPAPWLFTHPGSASWALVAAAAGLATLAHLLLSWGYARAETQVLAPVEYTAFVWAAVLGWLFFRENLASATLGGALLIVAGCWIGTRNKVSQGSS